MVGEALWRTEREFVCGWKSSSAVAAGGRAREVGAPATNGPFRASSTNPGGGRRLEQGLLVIRIPFLCLGAGAAAGEQECGSWSLWDVCG